MAENLSNQSVPEAAARVAAVVNRLVNRIGSNAESRERLAEIEIPEELRDNLALFLRLERRVLSEYDPEIADLFDKILTAEIVANAGNPGSRAADESVDEQGVPTADEPTAVAFREVVDLIDSLPLDKQQVIVRAFTSFFHLANLSEENYRVAQLREREAGASTDTEVDPANELTVAYHQLVNEMGVEGANELLGKLEFHPVFTEETFAVDRNAGAFHRFGKIGNHHVRRFDRRRQFGVFRIFGHHRADFLALRTALERQRPTFFAGGQIARELEHQLGSRNFRRSDLDGRTAGTGRKGDFVLTEKTFALDRDIGSLHRFLESRDHDAGQLDRSRQIRVLPAVVLLVATRSSGEPHRGD